MKQKNLRCAWCARLKKELIRKRIVMEDKKLNIIIRTPQKISGKDSIKRILRKEKINKNKRKRSRFIQLTFFDSKKS